MNSIIGNSEKERKAQDYANFEGTGGKDKQDETTAPVGTFKPNEYGLYDMAGNVLEWCQDWYSSEQEYKVLRGGSWYGDAYALRVAYRNGNDPLGRAGDYGVRCVSGLN